MNFGQALEQLRTGKRLARSGWNGNGMSVYFALGSETMRPYLSLRLADATCVPWTVSQTDVFADDWEVVTEATRNRALATARKEAKDSYLEAREAVRAMPRDTPWPEIMVLNEAVARAWTNLCRMEEMG